MKRIRLGKRELRSLILQEMALMFEEESEIEKDQKEEEEFLEVGLKGSSDHFNKILGFIWKITRDDNVDIRKRKSRSDSVEGITGPLAAARDEALESGEATVTLDSEQDKNKLRD